MTERYLKAEKCSCKERYPTYPGCGWRNSVRGWWRGGGRRWRARPTCPAAPFGNEISLNVIVAPPGLHPPTAPVFGIPALNRSYFNTKGEFDFSNNMRLADNAVKWANSDPRRTLNFTLLPDSPAFHNGFRPIAVDSIGPHTQDVADQVWR